MRGLAASLGVAAPPPAGLAALHSRRQRVNPFSGSHSDPSTLAGARRSDTRSCLWADGAGATGECSPVEPAMSIMPINFDWEPAFAILAPCSVRVVIPHKDLHQLTVNLHPAVALRYNFMLPAVQFRQRTTAPTGAGRPPADPREVAPRLFGRRSAPFSACQSPNQDPEPRQPQYPPA